MDYDNLFKFVDLAYEKRWTKEKREKWFNIAFDHIFVRARDIGFRQGMDKALGWLNNDNKK